MLTGGGSNGRLAETDSAKGIKGVVNVNIDGGTFAIDAADDAVHSNGSLVINGGAFVITTGDDGLHADATLTINAGSIHIAQSYEGIESAVITINGGDIAIVSSDDGLNVAGGVDGSSMNMAPGGGPGGRPNRGAAPAGTRVHIQSGDGQETLTFAPTKQYQSVAFSSPDLVQGESYNVYVGGSSSGAAVNGLYQGGSYTPGDLYSSVTLSSVVTIVGGRMR